MSYNSLQDSFDDISDTIDSMNNAHILANTRKAVDKMRSEVAVELRIFDTIYPQTFKNMFGKNRKAREETRELWSRIVGATRSIRSGAMNNFSSPEYLKKLSQISQDPNMPLVQDIKRRSLIWQLVPNESEQEYLHNYLEDARYPKGWNEQLLRYMLILGRDDFSIAKMIILSMESAKNKEFDADTLKSLMGMPLSHIFTVLDINLND